MKLYYWLIALFCWMTNCNSPIYQPTLEHEILKFTVHPSFHPSATFEFTMDTLQPSVEYHQFRYFFFKDSFVRYDTTKLLLSKDKFMDFYQAIQAINFETYEAEYIQLIDGMSLNCTKITTQQDTFSISHTFPVGILEKNLTIAFYKLMEEAVETEADLEYLEQTKDYLHLGLPIRKVKDFPLEYRIAGTIHNGIANEFHDFMEDLPNGQPIIFDFNNYHYIHPTFLPLFHYLNENYDIYYLTNKDYAIEDFNKIGNCKVFNSKEAILHQIHLKY